MIAGSVLMTPANSTRRLGFYFLLHVQGEDLDYACTGLLPHVSSASSLLHGSLLPFIYIRSAPFFPYEIRRFKLVFLRALQTISCMCCGAIS
jgi:hypothetical protein